MLVLPQFLRLPLHGGVPLGILLIELPELYGKGYARSARAMMI
ncbi:MAG: hypothetical protein ABWK01_01960 [Infirmifilum sp.]